MAFFIFLYVAAQSVSVARKAKKVVRSARHRWLTRIIPATEEAEIRRITV
jgi:hypothetical protein